MSSCPLFSPFDLIIWNTNIEIPMQTTINSILLWLAFCALTLSFAGASRPKFISRANNFRLKLLGDFNSELINANGKVEKTLTKLIEIIRVNWAPHPCIRFLRQKLHRYNVLRGRIVLPFIIYCRSYRVLNVW